jgi:peptidoglycan/LPS O-acetylase OafA/YrhL
MGNAMAKSNNRLEVLDCLRTIAVFAVLIYHYCFRGAAADRSIELSTPGLAPIARYGYLGVQLFFVISGFIIAYSAEGRSAVQFGIARFVRIYPAFIVCMVLTSLAVVLFGAPRFQITIAQVIANLIVVSPALKQPFVDGAYWSLVYELVFYAWVTLLLMLNLFTGHGKAIVASWIVISFANIVIDSSILRQLFLTDQSGFFAAGLMIHEFFRGRGGARALLLLSAATMTAILQATREAAELSTHYGVVFDELVVAAISLASIFAVWLCIPLTHPPIPKCLAVALGGCTYPLYLLHQQIGYILINGFGDRMAAGWTIVVVTMIVTSLAFVIWRCVERPIQSRLRAAISSLATALSARRRAGSHVT